MKHDKEIHKLIDEKFGPVEKKKRVKQSDERFTNRKYWGYVGNGDFENYEDPRANPDRLGEDKAIYRPRNKQTKLMRNSIYRKLMQNIDRLSPREKQVVQELANGNTMEETAANLGLKLSAVQSFLNRARKKFSDIKSQFYTPISEEQ